MNALGPSCWMGADVSEAFQFGGVDVCDVEGHVYE